MNVVKRSYTTSISKKEIESAFLNLKKWRVKKLTTTSFFGEEKGTQFKCCILMTNRGEYTVVLITPFTSVDKKTKEAVNLFKATLLGYSPQKRPGRPRKV